VKLTILNLSSNQFTGSIPTTISNLIVLKEMKLYNNKLSGEIPFGISKLVKLQYVNLSNNQLSNGLNNFNFNFNLKQLLLNNKIRCRSIQNYFKQSHNITRIKQVMGIITENKPVEKLIDKMGVKGAIQFAGGMKSFNSIGGMDYLFDKVDELLKDYTNLIIVDDMEDEGGGDKGTFKSVAYGERNHEEPTEPPYVYFNWSKNPMNNPKALLDFDKVLSEKLTPLDIPENVTKIILEKWVRKYYDNIPPISTVRFGDTLGYNEGFSKPDPNFKQNNNRQEYEEVYGGNQKEKKQQNNSSIDFRAIMDNMSEINNKVNVNNKKKYFSKNNNL
jgi:hypothetical protein